MERCKICRGPVAKLAILICLGIFAVIAIEAKDSSEEDNKCQTASKNTKFHLATKTPYAPEGSLDLPEGCVAKKIWILSRHGTRFPGDKDIVKMKTQLPMTLRKIAKKAKNRLCKEDWKRLKAWMPNKHLDVATESWLVEEGRWELREMALRYKAKFPALFPDKFSNASYEFRTTAKERAIESGREFAKMLFKKGDPSHYFPIPKSKDPLLEFYKVCEKYIKEVDQNPATSAELDKFRASEPYQNMLSDIQSRFNVVLSPDEVLTMYTTCTFESAWYRPELSPWCSFFTEDDLRIVEYAEDLGEFYESGYIQQPVTYEQSCPLLKNVFEKFQLEDEAVTTAYFAHSGTIAKLYSLLGLFKDDTILTSDSFRVLGADRKWRSSRMGKFASNIAFVMAENCSGISEPKSVAVFVQEKLTQLPKCQSPVCGWEEFQNLYGSIANDCDLNRICTG